MAVMPLLSGALTLPLRRVGADGGEEAPLLLGDCIPSPTPSPLPDDSLRVIVSHLLCVVVSLFVHTFAPLSSSAMR